MKPGEIVNHVCPRFEAFKDTTGEWRWNLKDSSDRIIASSIKGYKNRADCLHDIDLKKAVLDSIGEGSVRLSAQSGGSEPAAKIAP
jgi:uncharacterized protein YegP (UPF0339 family)